MRRSVRAADRHPRRGRRRPQPLPRHPPTAAGTRQPAPTTAPATCAQHPPANCPPSPPPGAPPGAVRNSVPAANSHPHRRRPHQLPRASALAAGHTRPAAAQGANSRPPTTRRQPPPPAALTAPPRPTHKKAPKILLRGFSRYSQRRQPALSPQCATPPGRPGRPRRGRRSQTRPLAAPSDPRRCPCPALPCASCRCLRWPRPSRGPCQPRA